MISNKGYILTYLIIFLIFNSCVFKEKKQEDDKFLFEGIEIKSVEFKDDRDKDYVNLKDSILLKKVNEILDGINSQELIKGQRQHGAKNIYRLKLTKEGDDLLLFINKTKDNEMTIDFFKEDREDNFNYFIGCLYKSDDLNNLLNERLRKLNKI